MKSLERVLKNLGELQLYLKKVRSGFRAPGTLRFAHLEKFGLNFSNFSFVFRVDLLHL